MSARPGAATHLYALVVAVGDHHSAVARGRDPLQIGELPLLSAPGPLKTNMEAMPSKRIDRFDRVGAAG